MPLMHCKTCHHEWEGAITQIGCNWCGGYGEILLEETALEKFSKKLFNPMDKLVNDNDSD
jgi:threonine synthase